MLNDPDFTTTDWTVKNSNQLWWISSNDYAKKTDLSSLPTSTNYTTLVTNVNSLEARLNALESTPDITFTLWWPNLLLTDQINNKITEDHTVSINWSVTNVSSCTASWPHGWWWTIFSSFSSNKTLTINTWWLKTFTITCVNANWSSSQTLTLDTIPWKNVTIAEWNNWESCRSRLLRQEPPMLIWSDEPRSWGGIGNCAYKALLWSSEWTYPRLFNDDADRTGSIITLWSGPDSAEVSAYGWVFPISYGFVSDWDSWGDSYQTMARY